MVAVAASDARMIGESTMKRAPARIWPGALGAGGGPWGPIRVIEKAESMNEAASTSSATGPENTWTRKPPSARPLTKAKAQLPLRRDYPRGLLLRGSIDTYIG